eukprot:9672158-Prorocentrum_lima.AAC.1
MVQSMISSHFLMRSINVLLHIVLMGKGWRIMYKLLGLSAKPMSGKREDHTAEQRILTSHEDSI